MALDATRLKNNVKSAVDAITVDNGAITNEQVIEAIAQAIIDEITSNGQVIINSGSSAGTYQIT